MIDHLVYATPDLAGTVTDLADRLGVRPSEGGRHIGFGTRNQLAALGTRQYLEVVGPDAEQPPPEGPYLFDIDTLTAPALVAWAVAVDDIEATVRQGTDAGFDFGAVRSMARDSADGHPIRWRMTPPMVDADLRGLAPFLVAWGDSPHPADHAAAGLRLASVTVSAPAADRLRSLLAAIGEHDVVVDAGEPSITAVLSSPRGEQSLR